MRAPPLEIPILRQENSSAAVARYVTDRTRLERAHFPNGSATRGGSLIKLASGHLHKQATTVGLIISVPIPK